MDVIADVLAAARQYGDRLELLQLDSQDYVEFTCAKDEFDTKLQNIATTYQLIPTNLLTLLKKYIAYVGDVEGSNFIDHLSCDGSHYACEVKFTPTEYATLCKINGEIHE